ncbi:hypothetical protein ACR3K2_14270 [Cryptosporidium serpentis]
MGAIAAQDTDDLLHNSKRELGNPLEKNIVLTGLLMPTTAAWHLFISLSSKTDCELCLSNPPIEMKLDKREWLKKLLKPWLFYLPPSSAKSKILLVPNPLFLDFVSMHLPVNKYCFWENTTSLDKYLNTRKNIAACHSMLKKLIENNTLYFNPSVERQQEYFDDEEQSLVAEIEANLYNGKYFPYSKYEKDSWISSRIKYSIFDEFCRMLLTKLGRMIQHISNTRLGKKDRITKLTKLYYNIDQVTKSQYIL